MGSRRRLDVGIASYRNPERLRKTLETIEANSWTDWRCFIIHNVSEDEDGCEAQRVAYAAQTMNTRFVVCPQPNNGYAGAVNRIFKLAETPYVAYLDNDVEILTPGWDEKLCDILDRAPEVAQVFPGSGHYGFYSGKYHECLWNAGYAWVMRKAAVRNGDVLGVMDTSLGHHDEVDLMIRLRLAGYRIACDPGVNVLHHCSSTNDPASEKRIHAGVVRFMNKWNRYFVGDAIKHPNPEMGPWVGEEKREHYDPRYLRFTDWHPCALYMERWTLAQFPDWNAEPEVVQTSAGPMDAIKILKPTGYYKGRAI
jgi:GT2 family glycosyltransferase